MNIFPTYIRQFPDNITSHILERDYYNIPIAISDKGLPVRDFTAGCGIIIKKYVKYNRDDIIFNTIINPAVINYISQPYERLIVIS